MVEQERSAQGRWSPAVVPLSTRTLTFLRNQVGPGQPRTHLDPNPIGTWRIPDGCPLPVSDADIGSMGMTWLDLDRTKAGVVHEQIGGVVTPRSARDVQDLLAWAGQVHLSVIPRGGGTSVVGGLTAKQPAILLDMRQMSRILGFDPIDALVHVEAGITGPELEQWLSGHGFTFGHVPQSWERASIGGYAVTASSGQASSGVGRFRDNVAQLTLQTPQGMWDLNQIPASAMGPDFLGVVSASEGTLGVVTDLHLRVRTRPARVISEGVLVPRWDHAVDAARHLAQAGIAPHVLRISDAAETRATWEMSVPGGVPGALAEAYCRMRGVREGHLMIMQWQGGPEISGRRRAAWRILHEHGAVSVGKRVGEQWVKHRFEGPYLRDTLLDHGYFVETFETATRWSNVTKLYNTVMDALADALPRAYTMAHLSHVYPTGSSLYFTVIGAAEIAEVWTGVKADITDVIQRHGGTASHHHGVGTLHAPWLRAEMGEHGMAVWAAVKHACDPGNIMNSDVWNAWQR
jgi:alkyldihydroxyacetonephosphate synthase